MKATELLRDEHRHIARALVVLEEMASRTKAGEAINIGDAEGLVHVLEGFADRHHQGKEEAILFPALLQDHGQQNYNALCRLIFEHNRERFLTEGLQDAIQGGKARDFVYCATCLVEKMRAHIDSEEHGLFGLTNAALTPDEDERVAEEMQQFEQAWQKHVLPGLLQQLDKLEKKYGGKTQSGHARAS